jgi:hypothetical protein
MNTPAGQEFEKYRETFNRNLNALFSTGIDNIVRDARAARAKALDTLRTNASDIKAQQAQIAAELYTFTGDPSFLAEAVTADARRATADIDRSIAGLRERSRTLVNGLGRLNATQGLDLPAVPELQVPAATLQFQNRSVELLQQIETNTKQNQQVAGVPGIGVTAGSLPSFARMPLGTSIGAMIENLTAGSGVSPEYMKRLVQIESGGNPNAYNKSGASGLLQFMPKTAAAYGLSDPFDPQSSLVAGNRLTLDNQAYLRRVLGRDPTYGELYLGHQQGAGGAAKLLSNPNALAADIVGRKAVTQNGGLPSMTAAEFAGLWTSKFNDLQPSASGGGDVAASQGKITTATRELNEAYRGQQAELEKIKQIAGTYSSDITTLVEKLKEQGATEQQIAAVKKYVADGSVQVVEKTKQEIAANGELITRLQQLKEAKLAYFNSSGMQAYNAWQLEGQNLDAMGKSLERYGTVADGLQFAFAKMRHNASTDFQIASEAMMSFTDKGAGLITGLITGTEKDWKTAAANMLREISQVIMKALIMRALTGITGGSGDGSGGGILGFFTGLFGGGGGGGADAAFPGTVAPLGGDVWHADGAIVNSVKNFKTTDGRNNKAAETGTPEAILPLRRGKGGRLGVDIAGAQTPTILPIVQPSASGGGGTVNFNPTFAPTFQGGGAGGQGGQPPSQEQMASMQRDFDQSMEATFLDFVNKHSKPGGVLHGMTAKYGQA